MVHNDVKFIIKIENSYPIELIDLTKSLIALSSQFTEFVSKNGTNKSEREAKLFVKEIKSGSVIFELIEFASVGLLPFADNFNTIVGFGKYCKEIYSNILINSKETKNLPPKELKELYQLVNPIAKDSASQVIFSTVVNGDVTLTFNLDSKDSNAIQNIINENLKSLKMHETDENVLEKVIMLWSQARSNLKSKLGNKGIIEEFSTKEFNVIFENNNIKGLMLHSSINPFITAFVVDVKVIYIKNKPSIYKIIKYHEHFEIEF